jgi:Spy/CpxP family protein refolding chaperone
MFGFLIGTLCLIGLIKVTRGHGRGYGHHGYGYGHGHGHWGGGRSSRRRWALRWGFRRLGTSAAQEKVILEAADSLDGQREKLFDELRASREDLKSALRGESFDEAKFRTAFERQQQVLASLQESVLDNARKVFDVLQPDQRKLVAEALEGRGRHCGEGEDRGCGYREAEAC